MFKEQPKIAKNLLKLLGIITGLVITISIFSLIWTKNVEFIKTNIIYILLIFILIFIGSFSKIKSIQFFFDGFKVFPKLISFIVNFILLTIVYFIGIGPISIISKLTGKHFMDLKKDNLKSYYKNKVLGGENKSSYYNQF